LRGRKHRERKLSGGQKSAREIPSQRGEIIAIVIAMELGFIGIIIFITIITITFIFCNTPLLVTLFR
jgi:cell division protein FtsW (lipid II flippase)